MAAPGFYEDRAAAALRVAEHEALKAEVAGLMTQWEEAQQALDALGT
jgi:hypothetical protein